MVEGVVIKLSTRYNLRIQDQGGYYGKRTLSENGAECPGWRF